MSRRNCIDGLVAQIQATNGFEATSNGTAVAYDHRVLTMGVDRAAIVLAESGVQRRMVVKKNQVIHALTVQLYVRHNNDVIAARQDADTYVDNIVTRINANPSLGGSVFDSFVSDYHVEDERMVIGNVPFLMETLTVAVEEHVDG